MKILIISLRFNQKKVNRKMMLIKILGLLVLCRKRLHLEKREKLAAS